MSTGAGACMAETDAVWPRHEPHRGTRALAPLARLPLADHFRLAEQLTALHRPARPHRPALAEDVRIAETENHDAPDSGRPGAYRAARGTHHGRPNESAHYGPTRGTAGIGTTSPSATSPSVGATHRRPALPG